MNNIRKKEERRGTMSLVMEFIEKARETRTARGRPSGMATTTTVMEKMKTFSSPKREASYILEI
jgi:hypothetical protein